MLIRWLFLLQNKMWLCVKCVACMYIYVTGYLQSHAWHLYFYVIDVFFIAHKI